MTAPQDGRALLARIKPSKRRETISMCLRPDLVQEHIDLDEKLANELVAETSQRLASGSAAAKGNKAIAKRILELEDEIPAATVVFTLEQLDKDKWQAILDSNPPREEFVIDMYAGYNQDAVLDEAIRECLIDPVFEDCDDPKCTHDDCGTFQEFAKKTPGGEWAELRSVANVVNSGVRESPKSVLASEILAPRGRGSAQRASGE